jgi:hypothetical protein
MSDADDERAFATYDDAANREPATGSSRRRTSGAATLSEYVPIRLSADAMEAVRWRAHAENMTISAWVRRLIDRALASPREDDPAAAVAQAIETLEAVRRSLDDIGKDAEPAGDLSRPRTAGRPRAKRTTR